ncbi:hypothetical protein BMS3Bbin10_02154 [bacterium BMS3Bbin10]|nr:hypothetical protein BMS3Bbin10_02154 [bacterium BMS3Bbin10]HDL17392.1 hypothetical protein [Hyphomicrobiales bacterium]
MKKALCLSLFAFGAAFAQTPSFAAGPEIRTTKCIYITGKSVKTNVPCTVKVYARAKSATEEWEWDNGTRTVVKMSDKGISVNGREAEERNASKVTDMEAYCYGIKATDEVYCWGK